MRGLLWTLAQHKYGWCYCPRSFGGERLRTAEALERQGFVTIDHSGSHPTCSVTAAGLELIEHLFPVSPLVLGTYDPQPGGWTPMCGAQAEPSTASEGDG